MGTGKSSVGKLLAAKLRYGFVDTDQRIEQRTQRKIADIFAADGEAAFRQMEQELAMELAQQHGLVIATGGKMMLDPVICATLSKTGHVFCLNADLQELLPRLCSPYSRAKRPLLHNSAQPEKEIRRLLEERLPYYQMFQQIDTVGKNSRQVADVLLHQINQLMHRDE